MNNFDAFKMLIAEERYAEAEALVRRALAAAPGEPFSHFLLGHALRLQERLSEAEVELRHALSRRPDYPEALNALGQVLAARGANQQAEEMYERAIAAQPGLFEAHYNLGLLLGAAAAADLKRAIDHTQRAIAIDPGRAEAHESLARWHFQAGHFGAAERACAEALRLAPGWALLHYHLGAIHARRRDYDASEDAMRKAVELEPQNPEWRIGLRTTRALADHQHLPRRRWTRRTLTMPGLKVVQTVRFNRRDVPVAMVSEPESFSRIVAALRQSATRHDPVLFRGQSRDWFTDGQLSLEPARFRRAWEEHEFTAGIEAWRRALRPYLGKLTDAGLPVYQFDNVAIAPPPVGYSGLMVDLGLANPELAGTMQHYGYPTDFLDVTSDPEVALWFALHASTTDRSGKVGFGNHQWTADAPIDRWPTVYALAPFRGQLVDLTDGCLTEESSPRVRRQRAALVSFMIFHEPLLSPLSQAVGVSGIPATLEEMYPDLLIALKLEPTPEWKALRMPPTDEMFPDDDPVFRELERAGVPHLRHYQL